MSNPPTLDPPAGARAYRLRTARGDFAVVDHDVAPGAAPKGTALLLPGFTGSKEDFHLLHQPLAARGYRTVAVDGRGQFESAGPRDDESVYAQRELARDVLAQIQALAAENDGEGPAAGPLHLLGHSMGGQVARAAVLIDHSPFASLTLVASGPARISPSQQERVRLLHEALAVMTMEEVWEAIQAMGAPQDAGGEDHLRRRWLAHQPTQLLVTGRQLCAEPDRVAELAALPLPFHVLSGAADDTWPLPLLDEMAVRLDAHRTVVEGAEHSPNVDRPLPTAEALADFWDGLGVRPRGRRDGGS
ncbi:alpha/beta fold hydrolase [Streptomyces sp. NPDC093094]|uniref:alpha/beta fold hydrolase n=1 Tax=Streptomyces sp. NPDC093094 TaxID=3366026 RepID=UPI0037FF7886